MRGAMPADTWLYIRFIQLELSYWQQQESLWDQAAVIIREQDQVIVQCNLTAERAGIEVGMALSDAWLLADELVFKHADATQQHSLLLKITTRLYQQVADLTLDPTGPGLWIHVHTQRRLYRNEKALREVLSPLLADYEVRWSFATNPLCAKLGLDERHTSLEQLAKGVAIAQAPLSPPLIHKLRSMGLRSLDKVLQMPISLLGKKLGEEIVTFVLRLTGEVAQPMAPFHPEVGFYAARQLHTEAASWGGLRFICKSLLQQLEQHLRGLQQATQRVEVVLFNRHYTGNPGEPVVAPREGMQQIAIELARPVFRAEDIFPILQLKLEPIKFAAPVVDVALSVTTTEGFNPSVMSLTETEQNNTQLDVLLNRLQARLGAARVQILQPQLGWLPELQQSLQAASQTMSSLDKQVEGWRPLWLQQPTPIDIEQWRLHGQPQRLSVPWWQLASVAGYRDYMLGQDMDGRWGWLYFEPDMSSAGSTGCWYLHGWAS